MTSVCEAHLPVESFDLFNGLYTGVTYRQIEYDDLDIPAYIEKQRGDDRAQESVINLKEAIGDDQIAGNRKKLKNQDSRVDEPLGAEVLAFADFQKHAQISIFAQKNEKRNLLHTQVALHLISPSARFLDVVCHGRLVHDTGHGTTANYKRAQNAYYYDYRQPAV